MKHNNAVPNGHFHKDWARRLKLWFDQPASKVRRRQHRAEKAKRLAPRPVNSLRPVVRACTVKYNSKVRAGRGFSLPELKAAGFNKNQAAGVGITVDHRRKNRSQEGFDANVARLKLYKSKLVVFRKRSRKDRKTKKAVAMEDDSQAKQVVSKQALPIVNKTPEITVRKISNDERKACVRTILRKALSDSKLWGYRQKRAEAAAEKAAAASKKADKAGDE